MPADLHIHTNYSDGTQTPDQVVSLAKAAKLTAIAITDHDSVEASSQIKTETGIEIIIGIEFTTESIVYDTEVHILGYYLDINNGLLLDTINQIQADREKRIYKMCDKLKEQGIKIDPEAVFAIAGHRAAARPHVAKAMLEAGYVTSIKQAFDRYIDFHGPAYVSHYKLMPDQAIKLIKQANGLAFFAHPSVSNCDQIIPELISSGLNGIEAFYPSHGQNTVQHYLNLAEKYGLLVSGGTDYHGPKSGREIKLGDVVLPDNYFIKIKNEHLH